MCSCGFSINNGTLQRYEKATTQKMPKIDTLDALEEHEEHDDDYQTITN